METIVIAVGSARRPKLNAVWEAVRVFGPTLNPNAQFEVAGFEVASGVRHTPLTRMELMLGARNRAEAVRSMSHDRNESWRYFVGLEGGLDIVEEGKARHVFLASWAYVLENNGWGSYGQSGAIPIPDALAKVVVEQGIELAEAVDTFAGERGIRDSQGAWGVLTRNMITRQDAFRIAVINAFAPFFNAAAYRRS